MDFERFAWWLRGFFEISGVRSLTEREAGVISKHLNLLFIEIADALPPVSEQLLDEKGLKELSELSQKLHDKAFCSASSPRIC